MATIASQVRLGDMGCYGVGPLAGRADDLHPLG